MSLSKGASAEPNELSQAEPVPRLGPTGFDPSRDRIAHLLLPFLNDEMTFAQARILADQIIRELERGDA